MKVNSELSMVNFCGSIVNLNYILSLTIHLRSKINFSLIVFQKLIDLQSGLHGNFIGVFTEFL